MQKSLLIVAHGSRLEASNEEVRKLALHIANMNHGFSEIKAAFLEIADPLIPEGIRSLIRNGAKEIIVYPYFLSAGRHVTMDIPKDVEHVQLEYPNIKITVSDYLGKSKDISNIILSQAVL